MMDSVIEQLPDRTIVKTGDVETCFGSMKSAAEQIALLQTEMMEVRRMHKEQLKIKDDEIKELREDVYQLEDLCDFSDIE